MNTYNYTYKGGKAKLTLSVNRDLVAVAKQKGINLSSFLEIKLEEILFQEKKQCGGRDSNTRTPTRQGPKPCAFS